MKEFLFMLWQIFKVGLVCIIWALGLVVNAWALALCALVGIIGLTVAFFGSLIFFNIIILAMGLK
jgi:xanthosine utilization system XapX-like protein